MCRWVGASLLWLVVRGVRCLGVDDGASVTAAGEKVLTNAGEMDTTTRQYMLRLALVGRLAPVHPIPDPCLCARGRYMCHMCVLLLLLYSGTRPRSGASVYIPWLIPGYPGR